VESIPIELADKIIGLFNDVNERSEDVSWKNPNFILEQTKEELYFVVQTVQDRIFAQNNKLYLDCSKGINYCYRHHRRVKIQHCTNSAKDFLISA
jgi:hypothetical protein